MKIVGIDCATRPEKVGLALGRLGPKGLPVLESATVGGAWDRIGERVRGWMEGSTSGLICMDAPLGWPSGMGAALAGHAAGDRISVPADMLFSRETDRFVRRMVGKRPMEVGAERIARTALAALELLSSLRTALGREIRLAWSKGFAGLGAIEVYPAGTLAERSWPHSGYKGPGGRAAERRTEILNLLEHEVEIGSAADRCSLMSNADVLDSAICVLAGADFLLGRCWLPQDSALAETEGWIWIGKKDACPADNGREG